MEEIRNPYEIVIVKLEWKRPLVRLDAGGRVMPKCVVRN
jgi:hypothetical protein